MVRKTPKLTLVDAKQTAATSLAPPATLDKTGRSLWSEIMAEYQIADSGGRATLRQICEAADRVSEFSAIIARDGPVVRTKHGPKDHPLLRHEQAARSFIVRSLQRLGLDVEPLKSIGRPPGAFTWRGNADE